MNEQYWTGNNTRRERRGVSIMTVTCAPAPRAYTTVVFLRGEHRKAGCPIIIINFHERNRSSAGAEHIEMYGWPRPRYVRGGHRVIRSLRLFDRFFRSSLFSSPHSFRRFSVHFDQLRCCKAPYSLYFRVILWPF